MVSSPAVVDISDNNWDPEGSDDFFTWSEPSPGYWVNYKVNSGDLNFPGFNGSDNFVAGRGYLVAYDATDPDKSFEVTGDLNTGDVDFSIAYSSTKSTKRLDISNGWNLLGNPYPSSIDWNDADLSDFSSDFAYYYDPNKSRRRRICYG